MKIGCVLSALQNDLRLVTLSDLACYVMCVIVQEYQEAHYGMNEEGQWTVTPEVRHRFHDDEGVLLHS